MLYQVTFTKRGYVLSRSFQNAKSAEDAIGIARLYAPVGNAQGGPCGLMTWMMMTKIIGIMRLGMLMPLGIMMRRSPLVAGAAKKL